MDHLCITISQSRPLENITKHAPISDLTRAFNLLGWFSPVIINMNILFQQLWEMKVDCDDPMPPSVRGARI